MLGCLSSLGTPPGLTTLGLSSSRLDSFGIGNLWRIRPLLPWSSDKPKRIYVGCRYFLLGLPRDALADSSLFTPVEHLNPTMRTRPSFGDIPPGHCLNQSLEDPYLGRYGRIETPPAPQEETPTLGSRGDGFCISLCLGPRRRVLHCGGGKPEVACGPPSLLPPSVDISR